MSSANDVAAEDENKRTIASGTSSTGKWIHCAGTASSLEISSRNPDARSIPTATINPTSVGRIFNTVWIPSAAPFTNSS